jgi:DNA modification methylase
VTPKLETSVIYRDDNMDRVARFPSDSVDLIYLDPPFFSNRKYEVIWGDEAEVRSFEDRFQGGIHVYVGWMRERLIELHRVLKPTGSLYIHCDPTASHYLKVMLDEVFGRERFRNEIVWRRSGSHNDARQGLGRYGRVHDLILFYGKGRKVTWNQPYAAMADGHLTAGYKRVEEGTGRRYMEADLTANKAGGDTEYEWKGVRPYKGRYWAYSKANMEEFERESRLIYRRTGMPRLKVYLDESRGVPLGDVWNDIAPISALSKERMGYPTQKPVALLERIIEASSNKGEVVLDPFCGCGSTLIAAHNLGREYVGIDISPTACQLIKRRLDKVSAHVRLENMPVTDEALRLLKPFEFQNLVIDRMNGTHAPRRTGDFGVDGFTWFEHLPVQVKQSERVGREVVDKFETAVDRTGKAAGVIVAFSFTRGAYEEAARVKQARGIDIRLQRASELFADRESHADAPLPVRPPDVPNVQELVASDTIDTAARLRKEYAQRVSAEEPGTSPEAPRSPAMSKRGRSRQRP